MAVDGRTASPLDQGLAINVGTSRPSQIHRVHLLNKAVGIEPGGECGTFPFQKQKLAEEEEEEEEGG